MRATPRQLITLLTLLLAALTFSACEQKPSDNKDAQSAPQTPQKPADKADAQSPPPATTPAATTPKVDPPKVDPPKDPAATPPPADAPKDPAATPPPADPSKDAAATPPPADAPAAAVTEADANAASDKMLAAMKDASALMTQHMADADKLLTELKAFVDPREADLNKSIKTIRAYKDTLDEAAWEAFHGKHTSREEYQTFATLQEDFNSRYPDKIGQLEELMDRVQGNDDDGSVQDVSDPK